MSEAMQDRLLLNESRIKGIADAVLKLAEAEDVIGSVDWRLCKAERAENI